MKTFIKPTLFCLLVSLLAFQCKDDTPLVNPELKPCYPEKKTVKVAKNKQGFVANYYFPRDTLWVILTYIGEDNVAVYDSRDVGVVCSLPDSLKVHGLEVIFSGDFKEVDGELKPIFPGHTMYYLSLTDIKPINANHP